MTNSKTTMLLALLIAAGTIACKPVEPTAAIAATTAKLSGADLCRRDLKSFITFRDPDSVKINSVVQDDELKDFFKMSVSAKNGFGGYANPTPCSCTADVATGKVTYLFCAS